MYIKQLSKAGLESKIRCILIKFLKKSNTNCSASKEECNVLFIYTLRSSNHEVCDLNLPFLL